MSWQDWLVVVGVIIAFKLFVWAQFIYWNSPTLRQDLKREQVRHGRHSNA